METIFSILAIVQWLLNGLMGIVVTLIGLLTLVVKALLGFVIFPWLLWKVHKRAWRK